MTNIVREMVTKYGFSIIGPISMDLKIVIFFWEKDSLKENLL